MIFIDCFSTSIDEMKRKDQRDPIKVLAVLAKTGKFSCFEASANQTIARTITDLMHGPLVTSYVPDHYKGKSEPGGARAPDRDTYPWTYVRLTDEGKKALAANTVVSEQMGFLDLPRNNYGAILADPPWGFQTWSGPEKKVASRGTVAPYQTMEMGDIAKLPVAELAAEDCALFMWVVWPTINEALGVMESWGFKYKTCAFTWLKADPYRLWALEEDVRMGLGYWTRANSEVCLLGTRGRPKRLDNCVRQGIIEPIRQHSRKPDCVHERIERLVAGPYLELFARAQRPGWDSWGNETDKYSPRDDFNKSVEECYRAVKERQAQGGEPWKPK